MALGPIMGPATVRGRNSSTPPTAVRNPGPVPPGSVPPLTPPGFSMGRGRNIMNQLARLNRADPRESMSLTEEELRKAALSRLRGMG